MNYIIIIIILNLIYFLKPLRSSIYQQQPLLERLPMKVSIVLHFFHLGSPISQYFEMLLGHVQLCWLVSYYYATLPSFKIT